MDKSKKNRGLGRGLSALMADVPSNTGAEPETPQPSDKLLPIEALVPNPDQPRKAFTEDALEDLTQSIRARGILQPLIVRASPTDPTLFEIVAGERRWRAAQRAQLHTIPVVVREYSDQDVLEIAIVENVQRADLNPIEEALGYRQLIERFGHTQEQLAQALGKSRSHIANLMRLLTLPEAVLKQVEAGLLSAGHARALVPAQNAVSLAEKIIKDGLSVRDTERLVKGDHPRLLKTRLAEEGKDADTTALERDLSAQLSMGVRITHRDVTGAGRMTITYRNLDQLDRLCAILAAVPQDETI